MTTPSPAGTKPAGPPAWTRTRPRASPAFRSMVRRHGRPMGTTGEASRVLVATGISALWIGRRLFQRRSSLQDGGETWKQLSIHLSASRDRISMIGALEATTFVYCNGDGIHRSKDTEVTW